jgi:hypothetical protein
VAYRGDEMADLFRPGPLERAVHDVADEVADELHSRVAELSPIDESGRGRGGNLKTSWYKEPPIGSRKATVAGEAVYRAWVRTDVDYAAHVEWGTGLWGPHASKYEIKPKLPGGTLSWINRAGLRVYARRVMHPGSPGRHMMQNAAAQTQARLERIAEGPMRRWRREQERRR